MSGLDLLTRANKKATASGGFFLFASGSNYESAYDLYVSAANAFKVEKKWKESGDASCKAAEMALKSNELDDAANSFWSASKSYKKTTPELAVAALQRTIQILTQKGRFRQAADREKEMAAIYQQEGGDMNAALEAYERAGDWYSAEDATATANSCYKEAADLAATLDDWARAVGHYERVASASLDSPLTRYSVKEYYMKAGLCWLASGDIVSTKRALENYSNSDVTFASTREAKFISAITDAVDAGDAELYTDSVAEYDRLTKLDNWKTSILLKIKRTIQEEPGLT